MPETKGTIRQVAVIDLLNSPDNYRAHPAEQVTRIAESLQRFGQRRAIVVQASTMQVVAGNGVLEAARQAGLKTLTCDVWECIDEEAKAYLVEDNESVWGAEDDRTALAELLADLGEARPPSFPDDRVEDLLKEITLPRMTDGEGDGLNPEEADLPLPLDNLYPTDNEWGIPLLDLKLQAQSMVLPCIPWGSVSRAKRMSGTWHFYTEDYRYAALWSVPEQVPSTFCAGVIEPNFSVYDQTPRACTLWRTYMKRWLARYWQSCGVRVFVDLNVAVGNEDLNLLGVPKGWRAYATRGYTERMEATEGEYRLACEHAGTDDVLFVVVGGGKQVRELSGAMGWVHVAEEMDSRQVQEVETDG